MANILPFHAYRYSPQAGALQDLLTQPYDKISPAMRERYLGLNPHNLVRVILGEKFDTDTPENNAYTRAAQWFREWRVNGVLVRDKQPAFYPYFQRFQVPGTGETLTRQGFIGLGEVVPYEAGIVHRHERTLSGPKKDRMQVLQATGAHFGQIFMLYPDRDGSVDALLSESMRKEPLCEVTDEYGTVHTLGRIDDPVQLAALQSLMSNRKLLIADGHHRYETAQAFREQNPALPGAAAVMMTFVNMYSPGLRILGTHRLVKGLAGYSTAVLESALTAAGFAVRHLTGHSELQDAWREPHEGLVRIGIAAGDRAGLLLAERRRKSPTDLDVAILHDEILAQMLGITAEAVRDEQYLRYIRGADVAAGEAAKGSGQVAFLLEPPTVDQVAAISFGGGVMPQKSTDFYPKLLTGMAIYRLDDGL